MKKALGVCLFLSMSVVFSTRICFAEEVIKLSRDGETLLVEPGGLETIQNLERDGWTQFQFVPDAKKDVHCKISFPNTQVAKVECATAYQGPKLIISAEFDKEYKDIGKSVNMMLTNHRRASAAIEIKL